MYTTMSLDAPVAPKSIDRIPLYVPNADEILPNAAEYMEFRRKYPRLGGGATAQPVAPAIPFIAAAHEHAETAPVISKQLVKGGNAETFEFNVPSYGYIRAIWLDVVMTAGTGVLAEFNQDAPFNAIDQVTLLDTNGAPIFGPLTGFNTFLSNLYGGYVYQQDPRALALFNEGKAKGNGAFRFQVRIPIEISHHDGTGCIGNQNASAPYRIRINVNSVASIYKVEPETFGKLTIQPILEAWSLPNAVDAIGRPQAQLPPNYGTVQYWSERNVTGVPKGNFPVQVLRVGNLIRNILFVGRKTSPTGERNDKVMPEFPLINWDARQLFNESKAYREIRSQEPLESPSTLGRPVGVAAYTFDRTNQDRCGDDKPWLWLPTVEATRLEYTGSFEEEGVVQVLTNDIAPAEVNPTQRYAVPNATGFHPETGTQNPNQP